MKKQSNHNAGQLLGGVPEEDNQGLVQLLSPL